ncbi:hypothetical protein A6J40_03050 [Legionella longbeachae]|nr:hypothetical protein A6J40_03050 [Legionella longbeachae]
MQAIVANGVNCFEEPRNKISEIVTILLELHKSNRFVSIDLNSKAYVLFIENSELPQKFYNLLI